MTVQPLTSDELEALESELIALDYKTEPWTEADLARQAEIIAILAAGGQR